MTISIINAEIKDPEYEKLITFLDRWNFNYEILDEEYTDELAKERERAAKLVEALEEIADMTGNFLICKKAKQSLTEYKK